MPRPKLPTDHRHLDPPVAPGEITSFEFEGQPLSGHAGESLAEALWRAGTRSLSRSPKYHRPRGAFCFAGQCGTCLVRVDGRPNVRACQVPVRAGLRCERQNAFPSADTDVLRAADWLFPGGMDHHHLMTGTKVGNALFVKLVREMGGTGQLPDAPDQRFTQSQVETVDVVVVGAGPAGLATASGVKARRPQARVLVIDQQPFCGGSWRAEPEGAPRIEALERSAKAAGVEFWLESTAVGFYPEEESLHEGPGGVGAAPGLLAVLRPTQATLVSARRFVYATGAHEQNLPFPGNDRPGLIAARACGRLCFHRGLVVARRVQVTFDPEAPFDYAGRLTQGLRARGIDVEDVPLHEASRLRPGPHVAVAVAAVPAPAFELPRQHGVMVGFEAARGGFFAQARQDGHSAIPSVFVAGDVTGYVGPENAETHGHAVGRAVGSSLAG